LSLLSAVVCACWARRNLVHVPPVEVAQTRNQQAQGTHLLFSGVMHWMSAAGKEIASPACRPSSLARLSLGFIPMGCLEASLALCTVLWPLFLSISAVGCEGWGVEPGQYHQQNDAENGALTGRWNAQMALMLMHATASACTIECRVRQSLPPAPWSLGAAHYQ
jgi:hypothetical protein